LRAHFRPIRSILTPQFCGPREVEENETEGKREDLLTPGEVAGLFRVNPKTVTRWANAGKLTPVRTLGGHRRYRRSEVERLLIEGGMILNDEDDA